MPRRGSRMTFERKLAERTLTEKPRITGRRDTRP
jgi:hypothetical protein